MQTIAEKVADFVTSIRYKDLGEDVVREVKRRVLDSIGVMFGAYREIVPQIAIRSASRFESKYGSRIFGTGTMVATDWAAFANGVLVRYLDFNDTYLSREALHPSDMIAGLLAVAEYENSSGRELVEAIVAAYEVACWLADSVSLRDKGYDHVACIAFGAAAGASKLLGLDVERTVQSLNIAGVTAAALRQTRAGELSMWKGCAAANATRHGIFSALLARDGMTGPSPIFEGEMGFIRVVAKEFKDAPLPLGGRDFRLLRTHIKRWPVEYHSMSAVDAVMELRRAHDFEIEDVTSIDVKTFTVSYTIIAKDPEKWAPKTRETADHSLPFIVTRALLDGRIWLDSFKEEKIRDERVLELLKRVRVEVDQKYDELYPRAVPNKVELTLKDGVKMSSEVLYPKGHCDNPLTKEELLEKFRALSLQVVDESLCKEVYEKVERMDVLDDVSTLIECLTFDRQS